jgi:thioredoxin-like negative regulator of GroEL
MEEIQTTEQFEKMIKNNNDVIVFVYSSFCKSCQEMVPFMDTLYRQAIGKNSKLKIAKINGDSEKVTCWELIENITKIPTCLLFRNGTLEDVFEGTNGKPTIREWVNKLLALDPVLKK